MLFGHWWNISRKSRMPGTPRRSRQRRQRQAGYHPWLEFLEDRALPSNASPLIFYATGADAGGGPDVKVYDAVTGAVKGSFFAYDPGFTGGVRVALGDV